MSRARTPARRRRRTEPRYSERRRAQITAFAGGLAALIAAWWVPWQLTALIGFDVMALGQLVWIWAQIHDRDPQATAALATVEDDSRSATRLVVLTAATVSLGAVVFALAKAKRVDQPLEGILTAAAIVSVILAWLLVHSIFTLRYAHLYYTGADGGIDFPGASDPDYRDFAYVAFTVGMSFTVAETPPDSPAMRRMITAHALLSYLFGAVIVGMVINILAGLIG